MAAHAASVRFMAGQRQHTQHNSLPSGGCAKRTGDIKRGQIQKTQETT